MLDTTDIEATIVSSCRAALNREDLGLDEDFFDRGASSLTIVDLQLQIEQQVKLQVPTSKLMETPSIRGWLEAYLDAAATPVQKASTAAHTAQQHAEKEQCDASV